MNLMYMSPTLACIHSYSPEMVLHSCLSSFAWKEEPTFFTHTHTLFQSYTNTAYHSPLLKRYPRHQVSKMCAQRTNCTEKKHFMGRAAPSAIAFSCPQLVFMTFFILYGGNRTKKYPVCWTAKCLARGMEFLIGRRTIKFREMSNQTLRADKCSTWWGVRMGIECGA